MRQDGFTTHAPGTIRRQEASPDATGRQAATARARPKRAAVRRPRGARWWGLVAGGVSCAMVAAGTLALPAAASAAATSHHRKLQDVSVGILKSALPLVMAITGAEKYGFFRKLGLKVSMVPETIPPIQLAALVTGKFDFASVVSSAVAAAAKGEPVRTVAVFNSTTDLALVGQPSVKKLSQLSGGTVTNDFSAASITQTLGNEVLNKAGIKFSWIEQNGGDQGAISLLEADHTDAAIVSYNLYVTQLMSKGYSLLFNFTTAKTYIGLGNGLITTQSYMQTHGGTIKDMILAEWRFFKYLETHTSVAIKFVEKEATMTKSQAKTYWKVLKTYFANPEPVPPSAAVQAQLSADVSSGIFKTPPNQSELFDFTYARAAEKLLKKKG